MEKIAQENVVVLIMAGGVGSRLWPISTKEKPKQFCHLTSNDKTMIQSIFDLSKDVTDVDKIYVSTNKDYVPMVTDQLPSLSDDNIIQEPVQGGTTASIALATIQIKLRYPDAAVVVVSSDCVIEGSDRFLEAISSAVTLCRRGKNLVSVGVVPTEPHTGYGYMKCGLEIENGCFEGMAYIEKPNKETADALLQEGGYIWNAGIFAWHVDVIRQAFTEYVPDSESYLIEIEKELSSASPSIDRVNSLYAKLENSAIDNAIMEKLSPDAEFKNVFVKGEFFWSDIGSYNSWKEFLLKDDNGNALAGNITVDRDDSATNSILICESPYQIKAGAIKDMIVSVCRNGNVLILPIGEDQNIKKLFSTEQSASANENKAVLWKDVRKGRGSMLNNVNGSSFTVYRDSEIRAANLNDVNVIVGEHEVRINC